MSYIGCVMMTFSHDASSSGKGNMLPQYRYRNFYKMAIDKKLMDEFCDENGTALKTICNGK